MGIVETIVIASWPWTLAAVLLDTADDHVADEVRELIEAPGDAKITDLHVWRVGPEAHVAIVEWPATCQSLSCEIASSHFARSLI